MSNYGNIIPNTNGRTLDNAGCAITLDANVCYTSGDTVTTPATITQDILKFEANGDLRWSRPLPNNISFQRFYYGLTEDIFTNYQESENHYYIGIQVQYSGSPENPSNSSHWVGATSLYTDELGNTYFVISPTSNNDNNMNTNPNGNNRGGLGWLNIEGVGTVVPVARVTGFVVYTIQETE